MKKIILLPLFVIFQLSTAFSTVYFVAPNGNDAASGNISHPFATIQRAQQAVVAGDTVYIRGGIYVMTEAQIALQQSIWSYITYLDKSGTSGNRINYWAYPGERPVFDMSNIKPANYRVTAFQVMGSWIYIKGLEVTGVQVTILTHTQSECFENQGSNNIYERLVMHDGMAIGFYLTKGANNLILNCDAYRNWDSISENKLGGNVDGFGCHPAKGGTGNVFRGCRAWFNSDDGYDLINAAESVTFDNCWSFYNGFSPSFASLGDGNGFKAGGYGVTSVKPPTPIPVHLIKFCMAYRNKANGFYSNHHLGGSIWYNNTAYRNSTNYNMLSGIFNASTSTVTDVPGYGHKLRNNLGFKTNRDTLNISATQSDFSVNSFTLPVTVTADDFVSIDASLLITPRQVDGSLPNIDFMKLQATSDLIDKGQDIGFPFTGLAPDLGAFELRNSQNLQFDSISPKMYGDPPFQPTASATSGLTVTFTSSNPFIAAVSGNTITAKNPGTIIITASQTGSNDYYPAPEVSHVLTISKATQTITFDPIPPKTVGDTTFAINAMASSNLPVNFTSSDTTVAKINGNMVTIVGIGISTITVAQAGNDFYNAASIQQVLTVVNPSTNVNQINRRVNLYPNPSDGHFVLDLSGVQSGRVLIENMTGQVIFSQTITGDKQLIDISKDPDGLYIIKLQLQSEFYTYKILKCEL